jgi:CubicO group peptidase (beta-lactamase class C family)
MPPDLDHAFELARGWVRDGVVPGVSIAVARHGELLGACVAGKKSAGGGGPVDERTLYSVASITKPFTAALVMRLVEQGVLSLDEPLHSLIPNFPGSGVRELTLRDLLRHTGGLIKDDPAEADLWERQASFDEIAASAAAIPVESPSGRRVRYSNTGYWLAGTAAAAATGRPFPEALRCSVLEPFGLHDTVIAPGDDLSNRIARRYGKAKIMNAPYGRGLASPSGGLFATAADLVRFAGIFLNDGRLVDGAQVLSRSSVRLMSTNQTSDLPGGIEGFREWPVGCWGLGWEVKGPKRDHLTGDLTSPATFSHFGQSGTLLWADPRTGIACAILANRDLYTWWSVSPARWARLSNAIVAALDRRA